MDTKNTEVGIYSRKNTINPYKHEVARLKGWLHLLKLHTLDGTVLALIDEALSGKHPLEEDYMPDNITLTDL